MRPGKRAGRQRGFTYMGALFLMMVVGLGLAGTGEAWSLASRRAHERELLWTGNQYARAIRSYYNVQKKYPPSLEELVNDNRSVVPVHHLRQLYPDPVTGRAFEGLRAPDGGLSGVRSTSDDEPMKQAEFQARFISFKGMTHYSDWQFLAHDPATQQPGTTTSTGTTAPPSTVRPRPPGT